MKLYEVFTIVMIFCAGFCTGVTFLGLYINRENKKWMEPLANVLPRDDIPTDIAITQETLDGWRLEPIQIFRERGDWDEHPNC